MNEMIEYLKLLFKFGRTLSIQEFMIWLTYLRFDFPLMMMTQSIQSENYPIIRLVSQVAIISGRTGIGSLVHIFSVDYDKKIQGFGKLLLR
jgi:hypothetical protein